MSMMDMGAPMPPPAMPEPNAIPTAGVGVMAESIKRDRPEPSDERKALVNSLTKWCRETREFRSRSFSKMRRDISFVRPGRQWQQNANVDRMGEGAMFNAPYECNLVQRHVQQRVAALYAKNPKVVAKRRKRLDFSLWDGSQDTLHAALGRAVGDPGDMMQNIPPTPPMPTPEDVALLADVEQGMTRRKMLDRVCKTLEILYTYYMSEGTPNFKVQAKQMIRRVVTTGVGYVQLGFQRVMQPNPAVQERIKDDLRKIEHLKMLASDLGDEEKQKCDMEAEELRLGLAALQQQEQIVLREGLVFDFPESTDILVDRDCIQLKGFIGARRVAREYHYTKDRIKEIFGVDVGTNFTQYEPTKVWQPTDKDRTTNVAVVWLVWDEPAGLGYFVCDGYPDFLREPVAPDVKVEQFFPLYCLSFNDIVDPTEIYPPSDVEIIRPQQLEYNRAREGLREHRIANKPGYIAARGMLDDEDKTNLENHAPNELIELNVPADAVKEIAKYIAARPTVPIIPEVYDTEYVFVDIQRASGDQPANLGGVSGATATESSIAETSRVSSLQSSIDDLDDFLTQMARDAGQILFKEMSPDQVTKIVGPGAVWPEMSREEIAEEIFLEIQAGSSGRPNKALEIANMEKLAPILIQMPGIKQEWLLRQMMMRLDENVDLEDAFDTAAPSVVAKNAAMSAATKGPQMQPGTGNPATNPADQGPKGGKNAIGVPNSLPGPKPDFPTIG